MTGLGGRAGRCTRKESTPSLHADGAALTDSSENKAASGCSVKGKGAPQETPQTREQLGGGERLSLRYDLTKRLPNSFPQLIHQAWLLP